MTTITDAWTEVRRRAHKVQREYAHGEDRPLGGYAGAMGVYVAVFGSAAFAARSFGVRLPAGVSPWDVTLLSLATHKASRMLAKDPITSPLRAPFTRFAGVSGESELSEEVRGEGGRHAAGELITCPFCVAQWVATAFVGGLVAAPRATRVVAAVFAVKAASDTLQMVYDAAQSGARAAAEITD